MGLFRKRKKKNGGFQNAVWCLLALMAFRKKKKKKKKNGVIQGCSAGLVPTYTASSSEVATCMKDYKYRCQPEA